MKKSQESHSCRHPLLRALLWAGLMVALLVLGIQVSGANRPFSDFVEYWAAGRLNAGGQNPYSPDNLASLQRSIGYIHEEPMMMWNPPWVLPLVMPFGLLPYPLSRLLWLLVTLGIVLSCADQIWQFQGGSSRHASIGLIIALTFVPILVLLLAGQISAFVLLGVVGFLYFERRQRWFLAGACTVLIAVKPQLLYLFWIALLLWVIHHRRWTVLLGALVGAAAATAVALAANPAVVSQYLTAVQSPSYYWITPTIGANLRLLFGWDRYWLQFMAPLLGAILFVPYWLRNRESWRWDRQMPALLLLCIVTTAFGWLFDQVVLLFVPIQIALWLGNRRRALLAVSLILYLAVGYIAIRGHFAPTLAFDWAAAHGGDLTGDGWGLASGLWQSSRAWGVWVAPALALLYWLAHRYRLHQ